MTSQEWIAQFREVFTAQTVRVDPDSATWLEAQRERLQGGQHTVDDEIRYCVAHDLIGSVDLSLDNQFIIGDLWTVGAPYRKEVSVDDMLGTYQRLTFRIKEDTTLILVDSHYAEAVAIDGPHGQVPLIALDRKKLMEEFPNPAELSIYNDIGMQY
jgi:hypothetical protein